MLEDYDKRALAQQQEEASESLAIQQHNADALREHEVRLEERSRQQVRIGQKLARVQQRMMKHREKAWMKRMAAWEKEIV